MEFFNWEVRKIRFKIIKMDNYRGKKGVVVYNDKKIRIGGLIKE